MQRRATYGTTDLSFKIAIGGSLLHFSFNNFMHREINCFDIINSFCSTGTLNELKITITNSFAKLKACLNLMC